MKNDRLPKILKGLLKCLLISAGLAAVIFVVIPLVLFFAVGFLLSPLIQQMPR